MKAVEQQMTLTDFGQLERFVLLDKGVLPKQVFVSWWDFDELRDDMGFPAEAQTITIDGIDIRPAWFVGVREAVAAWA